MSQCKRFLEAFSKNPGAFSGQVAVHLNELQLQMLSTLVDEFSLAQHLIGYPMLVVQDALTNLSDAVVLNALTQITAIERLIHFVAGEKSRLAAKGEDTLENVRKSVFHEAYRELSLKAFQEIIDKVCDMIDGKSRFLSLPSLRRLECFCFDHSGVHLSFFLGSSSLAWYLRVETRSFSSSSCVFLRVSRRWNGLRR